MQFFSCEVEREPEDQEGCFSVSLHNNYQDDSDDEEDEVSDIAKVGTLDTLKSEPAKTTNRVIFRVDPPKSFLCKLFPPLTWMRHYNFKESWRDLLSGITVGMVAIPQGMAYAKIAGAPPLQGLYGALLTPPLYFLFGTSPHLIVGPTSILSLITAGVHDTGGKGGDRGMSKSSFLALASGVVAILLGFIGAGKVAGMISLPLLSGFTLAAAITIATEQVPTLMGMKGMPRDGYLFVKWFRIFKEFGKDGGVNGWSILLGFSCLGFLLFGKVLPVWFPTAMIVVIFSTLLSWALTLEKEGIAILGDVPSGFPSPSFPNSVNFDDLSDTSLISNIISVVLMGLVESIAAARYIAAKEHIVLRGSQEVIAFGAYNLFSSFFSAFPSCGSFTRTAINWKCGVRSTLGGLISSILVGFTLLFLTPYLRYLPSPALAAIVIASVINMIDLSYFAKIWRTKKMDMIPVVVVLIAALFISIDWAFFISFFVSFLLSIFYSAFPSVSFSTPLSTSTLKTGSQDNGVIAEKRNITDMTRELFKEPKGEEINIEAMKSSKKTENIEDGQEINQNGTKRRKHKVGCTKVKDLKLYAQGNTYSKVLIIQIERTILFTNAFHFKDKVQKALNKLEINNHMPQIIIFDMSSVNDFDTTAVTVLQEIATEFSKVYFWFIHVKKSVKQIMVGGEVCPSEPKTNNKQEKKSMATRIRTGFKTYFSSSSKPDLKSPLLDDPVDHLESGVEVHNEVENTLQKDQRNDLYNFLCFKTVEDALDLAWKMCLV